MTILGASRNLKTAFTYALLGSVLSTVAWSMSEPCIPAGSTNSVGFDRPSLGAAGDPVDAEWTGEGTGNPQGWEDDIGDGEYDDHMGSASAGDPPSTASVDVENKGGNLSGPNGDVQNVGWEGDCIEVYVRWTYKWKQKVTHCVNNGDGSQTCTEYFVWKYGSKSSPPKEVCPCS